MSKAMVSYHGYQGSYFHCQHHMVMVYVDHMLIHYEKSNCWKLHCLTTKDSYKTTMQLNYKSLLKYDDFYFKNPFQILFEFCYSYTSITKWILYGFMYTSSIQSWSSLFEFVNKLHCNCIVYTVQLTYMCDFMCDFICDYITTHYMKWHV